MELVRSTCHDVSSADDLSQPDLQAFFAWWRGLADGRATPPASSWASGRHLVDDANIVALRRVEEHAFVYEHYGEGLTQLTGFRLQGQSLKLSGYDAALNVSSAIADLYVRKYEESIARGVALLTLNQAQINARVHAWERLLLPFGDPGDGLVVACVRPQLFRHEVLASLSRIARFGSATLEPVRRGETVVDYVMIEATALGPVLYGVAPLYLSALIDVAAFPDLMRRIEGAAVGECVLETTLDKSEGGEARFVRVEIFGAPVRPFVTVVDVTAETAATRERDETQRKLRDFLDTASDWCWQTDERHRMMLVSDDGRRIGGAPFSEFVGLTRREFPIVPEDREIIERHFEDLDARRPFKDLVSPCASRTARR
jgi:PAS domain-containing protein